MLKNKKKFWVLFCLVSGITIFLIPKSWQVLARINDLAGINQIFIPLVVDSNAATSLPTPIAPGTIVNPGFEQGQSGWTFNWNTATPIVSSEKPHTGTYSAKLGDGVNGRKASITESLTISTGKPVLRFWEYAEYLDPPGDECGDNPDNLIGDYLIIYIDNVRVQFWPVCEEEGNNTWRERTVNLNAYTGKLVWLRIEFTSDLTLSPLVYVDDFEFINLP